MKARIIHIDGVFIHWSQDLGKPLSCAMTRPEFEEAGKLRPFGACTWGSKDGNTLGFLTRKFREESGILGPLD